MLRTYPAATLRRKAPSLVSLLLIRRQAETGLLREGGTTVAQVCRYVRELRREIEKERALRSPGGVKKARQGRRRSLAGALSK